MLEVVTSCYDNNKSCNTALSFVDLRKAFNTVSHETLLESLHAKRPGPSSLTLLQICS